MKNKINIPDLSLRDRFMMLAGIHKKDTLTVLRIPTGQKETTVELKHIPSWIEKFKYKMCGFDCKIIRTKPEAEKLVKVFESSQPEDVTKYYEQ